MLAQMSFTPTESKKLIAMAIAQMDVVKQASAVRRRIGVTFQEMVLDDELTGRQVMDYHGRLYRMSRVEREHKIGELLALVELEEAAGRKAKTYSGGMKRRLMIARAMVNEPRLLILDEPTAGVDIEIRRSMWDFIREINDSGTTVILTTHYLEEAESLCRNIAIIDHGEIIQNTDMKSLLATLDIETFVLDLREPIHDCPQVEGMEIEVIDHTTIEASLPKQKSLNNLFSELERQGIHVLSMRNKANRLEELFLRLVENGAERHGASS